VDQFPAPAGNSHDPSHTAVEPVPGTKAGSADWRALVRALRPQQWVKNLLLLVPLVLAHRLNDTAGLIASAWAAIAFSAAASSVYLLNDLLDLEADRAHPQKRSRPLAARDVTPAAALRTAAALLVLAFGISIVFLPLLFTAAVLAYLVANALYSLWLKRKPMVDVLVLANLYTLRVVAGGIATDVPVSEWLLAFSTFFFLSLAFVKRYAELHRLAAERGSQALGRGYEVSDLSLLETMGPCSGYLSVLVLALYINGEQVKNLYFRSNLLWVLCALLLYWISRLWFWAKRGELIEDPVTFALRDRNSLIVAVLGALTLAAAAWSG